MHVHVPSKGLVASADAPRAASRYVQLLHVSNSGGTSVCQMASLLGLQAPHGSACNLRCKGPTNWNGNRRCTFDSCDALASHVRTNGWQFVGSETILEEMEWAAPPLSQPLCPRVSYVAVFKDPLSRIYSEVARLAFTKFRRSPEVLLWSWLPGCDLAGSASQLATALVLFDSDRCYNGAHCNNHTGTALMGTPAISNYAARLLLGRRRFLEPPDRLDAGDALREALHVLSQFSLVISIESLSSPTALRALARVLLQPAASSHILPAQVEQAVVALGNGSRRHGSRDWRRQANISERLHRTVVNHNRIDLAVYRFAQSRSESYL